MKMLLFPSLVFAAILATTGCDMDKRSTRSDLILDRDEVRTIASATSSYGASAGSAAIGNARYGRTAQPVINDSDEGIVFDEEDYELLERQAMEDVDYRTYKSNEFESEEDRLNRLQKENGIFYGYPSATGASGSPGSYELTK